MRTSSEFAQHCLDLFSGLPRVEARSMFGGHAFYVGRAMFAIGDADEWKVWLKVDAETSGRFEAALDLFSRQGYRGTSIRDISRVAGVSTGSGYHHFQEKEELFDTLLSQYWSAIESPDFPFNRALASGAFPDRLFHRHHTHPLGDVDLLILAHEPRLENDLSGEQLALGDPALEVLSLVHGVGWDLGGGPLLGLEHLRGDGFLLGDITQGDEHRLRVASERVHHGSNRELQADETTPRVGHAARDFASPVAGLGEKDEKGLVGDGRLLRVGWIVHAY